MKGRHTKRLLNGKITKILCVFMATLICGGVLFTVLFKKFTSGAYLYDQSDAVVSYSVSRLSFDLSSNHMYSYYMDRSEKDSVFESMLISLNGLVNQFESKALLIEDFNTGAIAALKSYYSEDMIDELSDAWTNYSDNQEDYDTQTRSIYNKYYNKYVNIFKIKSFQISGVENGNSIWYYYAKDLISTYYNTYDQQYVVQEDATEVKQSSIKIGVKLKGGTTYSNFTSGTYYDSQFNDMANAFTINFKNSGTVSLYLNFNINMNVSSQSVEADDSGVIGMLLPCGLSWEVLKNTPEYAAFYNTETDKWNYHDLIKNFLVNKYDVSLLSEGMYQDESDPFGSLTFSGLKRLLYEWNSYAAATYSTEYVNDRGNIAIGTAEETNPDVLKSLDASVIYWADYERNSEYYALNNDNALWKSGSKYAMLQHNLTLDIRTSLKNSDMNDYTEEEWGLMFNEKKVFDKMVAVSNFDVSGYAFFQNTDSNGKPIESNAKMFMEGGYINCNYTDPDQDNYIKKLRFNIIYRGFSPAYIRVRIIEQFTNTQGKIEAVNALKFNLADNWYDNRINDMNIYSNKMYYSVDTSTLTAYGKPKFISIPVIKGLDSSIIEMSDIDPVLATKTNLKLKMTFYIEAVQPNRTEEYWGLTTDNINAICNP